MSTSLLEAALEVAVPLWMDKVRAYTSAERHLRAHACARHTAEHGDAILYKSSTPGESALAFNKLAEGIAIAAFAPGGVTVFGRHWEAMPGG